MFHIVKVSAVNKISSEYQARQEENNTSNNGKYCFQNIATTNCIPQFVLKLVHLSRWSDKKETMKKRNRNKRGQALSFLNPDSSLKCRPSRPLLALVHMSYLSSDIS